MILTKTMKIKYSIVKNKEKYKKLNNLNASYKGFVDAYIEDIAKNSHIKILVKCDICGKIVERTIQCYNKSVNNGGYYCCSPKCAMEKNKTTNLERHGYECPLIDKNCIKKGLKTNLKKYGNECPNRTQEVRAKAKKTNMEKYGVEEIFKDTEKCRAGMMKNHGINNPSLIPSITLNRNAPRAIA